MGLLLVAIFPACSNQIEDLTRVDGTRYRADYAVPLIDSKVKLKELIGDVTGQVSVSVDPDGLLRFRYSGEVPAVGSDVIFARLETIAQGIFLPITQRRQAAPFAGPGDVDLNELRISGGALNYVFPNTYPEPVRITFSIPDGSLDGVPFSVSAELPAFSGEGTPPALTNPDLPVDLENYILTLSDDSLYFEIDIEDLDGNDLAVTEGSVITITNLRFSYVEGYLGQEFYPGGRDTIEVDFFDNYLEGDIYFENPTVTMTLINTFGVPARALVDVLNVIDVNGNIIPIEGTAVDNGFDFDFPRVPGETAITTFVFDKTNSNIDQVLSARPVALDYEINALINPNADTEIVGFLTDTSSYRATVDVELPLYGNASDFTVRDTFEIDLMDRYEDVVGATFRLTTKNGLPLDLQLRGTFLDPLGNALADLTDGELQLLRSSPIDAAGNPEGVTTQTNDLRFEGARLEAIRSATQLVLMLDISTSDGGTPFVRVTDEQELTVLLGAIVTVEKL